MTDFYSQNGEDELLWRIFGNQTSGFFLDIGAHDGRTLSNTLAFEKHGWNGVCVEPNALAYEDLITNRPHTICIQAACGERYNASAPFWATPDGYCSTLNSDWLPVFGRVFGRAEWKQDKTIVLTIDQILEQQENMTSLDLLSVDTEGTELDVLRGMDTRRWRPRIIIVEAFSDNLHAGILDWALGNGYSVARRCGVNFILCGMACDVDILRA